MKHRIAVACIAALLLPAAGAFASDDSVNLTDDVAQRIRAQLTEQGYEVGKINSEDGFYEAYVKRDGQRAEVYLNAALEVVRTKVDD